MSVNTRPRKTKPSRRPVRQPTAAAEPRNGAPHRQERLQKALATAGVGSRRQCEELILNGRVEVDGAVVNALGTKVDVHQQEIRVDGEVVRSPQLVYYAVHKPQGVVSTAHDPSGRLRVIDLAPDNRRVFAVGRLDLYSEGLILLTNDGELANHLTHPRYGAEKTYHVLVAGVVEPEALAQLRRGQHLAEGFAKVLRLRVKSREKQNTWLEMVLNEGRNREIRRLFARVGHKALRVRRVAVASVRLGDLPPGAYRPLRPEEVSALKASVQGAPASKATKSGKPPRRGPKRQKQTR